MADCSAPVMRRRNPTGVQISPSAPKLPCRLMVGPGPLDPQIGVQFSARQPKIIPGSPKWKKAFGFDPIHGGSYPSPGAIKIKNTKS